jgi:hypothetical protein
MARFKCACPRKTCGGSQIGYSYVSRSTQFRHAHAQLTQVLAQFEDDVASPSTVEQEAESDMQVDDDAEEGYCSDDREVSIVSQRVADAVVPGPPALDIFRWDIFRAWETPARQAEQSEIEDASPVLLGELLLTYFEWMCVHKPTNECAKAVHAMLSLLLPPDSSKMPKWNEVHSLLAIVYENVVVEVEMCPNDCVAFVDATHPKMIASGYMYANRTYCPRVGCGAARWIDIDGKRQAVKKG